MIGIRILIPPFYECEFTMTLISRPSTKKRGKNYFKKQNREKIQFFLNKMIKDSFQFNYIYFVFESNSKNAALSKVIEEEF